MKNIKELFGKKVKEYRVRKKFTQSHLAELVDVDNKHISCIENGKNFPSATIMGKIAEALEVEPKELFEFYHLQEPIDLEKEIILMLKKLNKTELELAYKYIRTFLIK